MIYMLKCSLINFQSEVRKQRDFYLKGQLFLVLDLTRLACSHSLAMMWYAMNKPWRALKKNHRFFLYDPLCVHLSFHVKSFPFVYYDPWFVVVTKFGILLKELIGMAMDGILWGPELLATDAGTKVDDCMAAIWLSLLISSCHPGTFLAVMCRRACLVRWSDLINLRPQSVQANLFSPVWVLLWRASSSDLANLLSQPSQVHGKGFSPMNKKRIRTFNLPLKIYLSWKHKWTAVIEWLWLIYPTALANIAILVLIL